MLFFVEIFMPKPRLFIGSSVEGKEIAEMIQLGLEYDVEATIWYQGVFGLSQGSLESLVTAANSFDFAVLILTPDDLKSKRGDDVGSPRDNVIFELGLFMGALGRERTFIVYCRDFVIDFPTDLAGVTPATFGKRSDNNMQAALGPVCTKIKSAISSCGYAEPKSLTSKNKSSEIVVKQGLYWNSDDDGPFCTTCYDTTQKLIRLTEVTSAFRTFGRLRCNFCKSYYS
jgi:Predicted nucleotide-binding protein containing TIR-like domain